MIEVISYGDKLENGTYKVHSKFDGVVNCLSENNYLTSVVSEKIGEGPLNIVVKGNINFQELVIDNENIFFNQTKTALPKKYSSKIETKVISDLELFKKYLLNLSSDKSLAFLLDPKRDKNFTTSFEKEFIKRMKAAVELLFSSDFIAGVKKIKGLGFGLTPSGDDFLCGILIALNLLEHDFTNVINTIYQEALGENILSNASLLCARDGSLFHRTKKLVQEISNDEKLEEVIKEFLSIGATSSADMGVGLYLGLTRSNVWL